MTVQKIAVALKVDGQQHEDAVSGSSSPMHDNSSDTARLERDSVTEDQMQQSGHGAAFQHIMQKIPDFIKNAGPDSKASDGSHDRREGDMLDNIPGFAESTQASPLNASDVRTE